MLAGPLGFWLREIRVRRLPTYALGCLLVLGGSFLVPTSVPVVYRPFTADPWQVLWAVPACFLVLLMDPSHDHMEVALARRPWVRRAYTLILANALVVPAIALGSSASSRQTGAAIASMFLVESLVLVLGTLIGRAGASAVAFTALLATWVFGLDERTLEPHAWAVLMRPFDPAFLGAACLLLAACGAWWASRGTRS